VKGRCLGHGMDFASSWRNIDRILSSVAAAKSMARSVSDIASLINVSFVSVSLIIGSRNNASSLRRRLSQQRGYTACRVQRLRTRQMECLTERVCFFRKGNGWALLLNQKVLLGYNWGGSSWNFGPGWLSKCRRGVLGSLAFFHRRCFQMRFFQQRGSNEIGCGAFRYSTWGLLGLIGHGDSPL
jgi:hypothetical protein